MAELPRGALHVAVEVERIASAPANVEERAQALLDPLRRVVPFEAFRIALFDPARRKPVSLVVRGYDDNVRAYFDHPAILEEWEQLSLNRERLPIRIRDFPVPPAEVRGWAEYLEPAGFREGLAVGLFSPNGRFLGILGMNTDTAVHPTDPARDLIGLLAPMIAHAIDPLRSISAAARIVRRGFAGIILNRAGDALRLPGLPADPVLSPGSAVLAVAAHLAVAGVHASFLCPYRGEDVDRTYVRVTVLSCRPDPPYYPTAAVVLSPSGDLRGLTPRELEILGQLVEGWSNRRIAASLVIAQRTVATHVEHVLAKLGARTRTLAAVRALQQGLYVPTALTQSGGAAGRR